MNALAWQCFAALCAFLVAWNVLVHLWATERLTFKWTMRCMFAAALVSFALAGMAHAQYQNTITKGVYDLTANVKAGLNVWKNLPSGGNCEPSSGSMSYGGTLYFCINPSDGFSYAYNRQTHAWVQQTQLGTGMKALAVKNPRAIYGLFPSSLCTSPDMVVEFYDGNSWKYTPSIGCLSQITVGGDGFVAGITNSPNYPKWLWNSPDGGKTWNHWDTNWLHVHMWSAKLGCAVNANGSVYTMSTSGPPQDMGGNFVGCMYGDQPFVLLAWDASGNVSMVDEQNGAWDTVSGLKASHIAGFNKLMVVALDQTNKPFHWNIKAKYWQVHATGTWNSGCPSPSLPCHSTTQHQSNVTAEFTSGHGIGTKSNIQKVIWNQPMDNLVWDSSPGCDPIFGAPADPECAVNLAGYETCLQSGQGVGSAQPPPDDTEELSHDYQNAVSYTNRLGPSLLWVSPTGVQDWYGSELLWMQDACFASIATCDGPNPEGLDALAVGGFGGTTVEYVLDTYQQQNPWLSETPWDYSGPGGGTYCYTEERITWGTEGNFDDPNFLPTCD